MTTDDNPDRPLKGSQKLEPPQYEPIATLGKLGIITESHFLDPSGGSGNRLLPASQKSHDTLNPKP